MASLQLGKESEAMMGFKQGSHSFGSWRLSCPGFCPQSVLSQCPHQPTGKALLRDRRPLSRKCSKGGCYEREKWCKLLTFPCATGSTFSVSARKHLDATLSQCTRPALCGSVILKM